MRVEEIKEFLSNDGSIDDISIDMEPSTEKIWSKAGIEDGNFKQTSLLEE